ncbi:beta-ketoacyl synthase N-terminal-like domain-containing protein [Actinomadura chibensis]|uniref:Ketosynthase chain-length factor n=1 Tax=Actinomadura chibensis TaxID=392828 RepID=A0A5D0NUP7_9ACTN|nr:beta-ketoacyl synthase N-terminal-like domain-containing protein [Actinomadura chibensis]TYB47979.1 ketosynthase chain-length factor [Actinomadura chibensis]
MSAAESGGDPRGTAVWITGVGVAAPTGIGAADHWDATLRGRSGIAPLTRFDTGGYPSVLAGQVTGFDPEAHLPKRLLPQTDVSTRLALTAAAEAIADARLDTGSVEDYDMGIVTSNATGGFEFTHREFRKLWRQGPSFVSVYESFAWFYAVNTGQISIRHGLRGPGSAFVADHAGGLDALGHARRLIRKGTPVVVAGGTDSALDPWGYASHIAGGQITRESDPARAYLPFDAGAAGHVPGEGGALLVLESRASAEARGAAPRAEVAGYATGFDPAPGRGRPPVQRRVIESALADAGIGPGDVDAVFADAAAVPAADAAEARAVREVFGRNGVPVTAPKALVGRLGSGGGPLDVATAAAALDAQLIPPTGADCRVPDSYGIDLVRLVPRPAPLRAVVVLARGLRGFASAVVLRTAGAH